MNNLVILYVKIFRGFQTDIPVAAFLDIKAYDNVVIDILINRLTNLSIPPIFCRLQFDICASNVIDTGK